MSSTYRINENEQIAFDVIYLHSGKVSKYQVLEWLTLDNPLLMHTASANYIGRYLRDPIEKMMHQNEHL